MTTENQLVAPDLLINNENVLMGLSLYVTFDDATSVHLEYKETIANQKSDRFGDFTEFKHYFMDKEDWIKLSLKVKQYRDFTLCYVGFQLINERIQSRHLYLSPENSIVLSVVSLGNMSGLLANYQHKDWWTRPYFSTDLSTLPERTQSLLWKREDTFYYLLPVTDKEFTTRLAGSDQGFEIKLSTFVGGDDEGETLAFTMGKGNQPYDLVEKVVGTSIEHLGSPTQPRKKKRYPQTLDYLGWCSWDAFYHQVSETGLIEKMDELNKKKLPVKWMMIDDGWLDVKENRLQSFEPDQDKFPNGLFPLVKKLKEQYGVNWVGVWHTIAGYWGGILPGSDLAKTYQDALFQTQSKKIVPNSEDGKGFKFWNDWHTYLKQQGIDFIKVDSQSAINNFLMYQKSIGEAARGIHAGLEASAGIHFDQCMINCMGMASENVWDRPISSISRNSDDFVPGEEISFKEHALQNVYNSYYHGQFYWGDWDMFWTMHDEAIQNAVLRSVSGGPIYFSDKVGETNPSIIWPLIFNDGQIIRADQPGLPTEDSLFVNPNEEKVPLKVWNTVKNIGIIAAFNIHLEGELVEGMIRPTDIPNLKGKRFIVYDYFNQKTHLLEADQKMDLFLEKNEVALYLIYPFFEEIVPMGLVNKYLAPAAIEDSFRSGKKLIVRLNEGGSFGFYFKGTIKEVLVNGKSVAFTSVDSHFYVIDCKDSLQKTMVEIEIEE